MYRDTELLKETLRDIMPLRKALRYDPHHGCANLQLLVLFTISSFSEIQNTETAQQNDYHIYNILNSKEI